MHVLCYNISMRYSRYTYYSRQESRQVECLASIGFEDIAEVEFAIGCIEAMRKFFELHPGFLNDDDPDSIHQVYADTARDLRAMADSNIVRNVQNAAEGLPIENHLKYNHEVRVIVVEASDLAVRIKDDVRECFPDDRIDLLTLFCPAE